LFKITVRMLNRTTTGDARMMSRDAALMQSLVSTHTILDVRGGDFVSLLDPPEQFREAVTTCRNVGTWPVLVGEQGNGIVYFADSNVREVAPDAAHGKDIFEQARRLLLDGMIIAVKGIGGFHFACDALNPEAVERLRARKYREDKPFAMMANSIDVIKRYCIVSEAEEELPLSERRPVVLLTRKPDSIIPRAVAPGVDSLGFVLPYSPLHHLLFEGLDRPLVMTSGNVSDEPSARPRSKRAWR
jgi:tRNA A37 threonylcarbamoyladenosine synthetase subunit TsaC/SUA5/YrdC